MKKLKLATNTLSRAKVKRRATQSRVMLGSLVRRAASLTRKRGTASPLPKPSLPLSRFDPTRTTTLRRNFARELKRRFARLRLKVFDFVVRQDGLGLRRGQSLGLLDPALLGNSSTLSELVAKPCKRSEIIVHGGKGSGNFGHKGRPGKRGGSAPRASYTVFPSSEEFYRAPYRPLGNTLGNQDALVATVRDKEYVLKRVLHERGAEKEQDVSNFLVMVGFPTIPVQVIGRPDLVRAGREGWKGLYAGDYGQWVAMPLLSGGNIDPSKINSPRIQLHVVRDMLVRYALGDEDANLGSIIISKGVSRSVDWGEAFAPHSLYFHGDPRMYSVQTDDVKLSDNAKLDTVLIDRLLAQEKSLVSLANEYGEDRASIELIERLGVLREVVKLGSPTVADLRRVASQHIFTDERNRRYRLKNRTREYVSTSGKKILYTGVELDSYSKETLVSVFGPEIPKEWRVVAHHMTIDHPSRKDFIDLKDEDQGAEDTLKVVAVAKNDKVIAVKVIPSRFSSKNKVAHITLAVGPGGKPVDSNDFREEDWKELAEPFDITGKGKTFVEGEKRVNTLQRLRLPKDMVESARQSTIPHGFSRRSSNITYMISKGHISSDIEKAYSLLTELGQTSGIQAQAKVNVLSHLKSNSPVGRVLRDHIDLEEALYDEWSRNLPSRIDKALEEARADFVEGLKTHKGTYYEELGDLEEAIRSSMKDSLLVYRKGSVGSDIESWTSLPRGAVMNPRFGGIGVDHAETISSLREKGYRILGGGAKMMGAPGEGEITLIRLPDVTTNASFSFTSDEERVKTFETWLRSQPEFKGLSSQDDVLNSYVQQGFSKGTARSYDEVKRKERATTATGAGIVQAALGVEQGARKRSRNKGRTATTRASGPGASVLSSLLALATSSWDEYKGGRDEFLKSSFRNPGTLDKLKLLTSRVYTDLRGVTEAMATVMTRVLADGLVQGKSPLEVGRDLAKVVDGIGAARAVLIAQTELIRAHAEGQLNALEQLGIEGVEVQAEWSTAGDGKVCTKCKPMQGITFSLEEARGQIPRHPRCRCAWVPSVAVPTDSKDKGD